MSASRIFGVLLAGFIGGGFWLASPVVEAQGGATPPGPMQTVCKAETVAWSTPYGGTLEIICGGHYHFGFGPTVTGACPGTDIETRRSWQSLAQTALLSGRTLYLEFTACTAPNGRRERALTKVRLN